RRPSRPEPTAAAEPGRQSASSRKEGGEGYSSGAWRRRFHLRQREPPRMNGSDKDLIDSSSDRLPHKPTRDAVANSPPTRDGTIESDPAGADQGGKRFAQDRQAVTGENGTTRDTP